MEQVLYSLPEGWHLETIGEVASKLVTGKTPSTKKAEYYSSSEVDWFTPSDFGSTAVLNNSRRKLSSLAIEDGTIKKMPKGSILLVAIGATIGKVGLAEDESCFNQQVTGIHFKEKIHPKYAYYWLSYIKPEIITKSSQATLPIINQTGIKGLSFLYPEKEEQKRIVEKLDALLTRIDTAIEHLQESVTLADALYASELASVFSSGQDKWPLRELNEVAEVARGKSKHRPRNDKSLFGGEYPFIQTGDVRNAQKYIKNYSATYNEKGLQQSKLWPKDTICLTIAANIGDVAILGMRACFPDSVVGISSSELETDYLYYFLTTLQQQLDSKANAAAQKNINLKILSEIKIPVPSLDEQKSIVRQINEIDRLAVKAKAEISEKITMMQQLKASILDSAFKGEL
ncbi:restriction endonuclease subunit S [Escherichia coli]|nr:restriction endonuclease subunit S [Escherichia coli]MCV5478476.1 restriction endonuclease subunit S [Escherichia coli]MCV5483278.1 restriction endonuclease subunit S [Escherichia coli]HCT7297090.1 restriction endonuclease subunit S [Escherichia coli]